MKVNFVVLLFFIFLCKKKWIFYAVNDGRRNNVDKVDFFSQVSMQQINFLPFTDAKKTWEEIQRYQFIAKCYNKTCLLMSVCFSRNLFRIIFIILEISILEGFSEYNVAVILWWENGFIEILNRLVMRATGSVTQAAATVKHYEYFVIFYSSLHP